MDSYISLERIIALFSECFDLIEFEYSKAVYCDEPNRHKSGGALYYAIRDSFPNQPELIEGVSNIFIEYAHGIFNRKNISMGSKVKISAVVNELSGLFNPKLTPSGQTLDENDTMFSFTKLGKISSTEENYMGLVMLIWFKEKIYICRTPKLLVTTINCLFNNKKEAIADVIKLCESSIGSEIEQSALLWEKEIS